MPEAILSMLLHLLLCASIAPAALGSCYLFVLTLLSWKLPTLHCQTRRLRFAILIPAHNEAQVITRTLASLNEVDWPDSLRHVLVIADNCDDDTARLALAAGAEVIERKDDIRKGKGYALEFGVKHLIRTGRADAVVVIDADTEVSPNLLSAFAARLEQGAHAIQAHYGVLNPDDTWRTRLMTIAYAAFHVVRSRARERLNLSCGLRGNGMCFSLSLLHQHPPKVHSLAEDVEYGIILGLHGVRVHYVDEAQVSAELPVSERGAETQRHRWETGRLLLMRRYTVPLIARACRKRCRLSLDLALDLLTLPVGYLALNIAGVALLVIPLAYILPHASGWLAVCAALAGMLTLHVLRGWQLCPLGPYALLDLLRAPFFVAWKLAVLLRHRRNGRWVRTERNPRR